uniref:WAP domain-containing protein n=1 Tax=Gopherus agassizii TaxID=38772 RepID=A0A452HLK4_9SAUR
MESNTQEPTGERSVPFAGPWPYAIDLFTKDTAGTVGVTRWCRLLSLMFLFVVHNVVKPGLCPARAPEGSEDPCFFRCLKDGDCPGNGKCCLISCGRTCLSPMQGKRSWDVLGMMASGLCRWKEQVLIAGQ